MSRLLLMVVSLLVAGPAVASQADLATVERMLNALGGRAVWAATTSTMNDSQQNRSEEPAVVRSVIWLDFTAPRFRIETKAPEFSTARVINGAESWRRLRTGMIESVPADLYDEDMKWWGAHVYRSIHRLAARDPKLTTAMGKDGRLEVFEGGQRLIWFRLDPRGEPYAFGQWNDEAGTVCGPWEFVEGGMKHPIWVSNPAGTWRANIKALALNPKIDAAMLAWPQP